MIYSYKDRLYPDYLRKGNACQFIAPAAKHFCNGKGLDIGSGKWPLPGAIPVEIQEGNDALDLPKGEFDFIFSSHCLEHLVNPVEALEHWKTRLRKGGVLFLYLPHPDMEYWLPQNCRKHLHSWGPKDIAKTLSDLGFANIIHSERDLAWSFAVVAFNETSISLDTQSPLKREVEDNVAQRLHVVLKDEDLLSLHQKFGGGIFRRSSVFHDLDKILRTNKVSGKCCFEIGTFHGITTVVLSRYFDRVVSVDILDSPYKHEVVKHLGIDNIEFRVIKDNKEKAEVAKSLDFDFAYMDGDHKNDTRFDWKLVRKCGHVLFHEYHPEQPSVFDLVNSLPETEVMKFPMMALWKKN